ncbi:ABC transporter ATP-binding protein [Rhizobium sp. BK602]|uniref:ABC transporter ATP-binding protein n=1 Tax=Rhizobium sp. BK602 TaxID=2586986 RepID=UPI0016197435|nr:ABC transporter ATP-binding protein [Rhizobium sp. BK602]MBB3612529.1 NitT/TauT family transport system ATP-binding protein [Rhizobium sp. BK602]
MSITSANLAPQAATASAPQILARGVNKIFGKEPASVTALKDIDLEISAGEFVCLLGPSGCGKSTLLNAIAGFSLPTTGTLEVSGKAVAAPGPDRGMVFQEYALFPWMTVERNIAFGLEIRGLGKQQIAETVNQLLDLLGLKEFRQRFPKDLSGGMRQRVAIARVLALDPPIMLMDEPFGALDALTRRSLQDELLRIWQAVGKTIVFVTHSIEEAIYLGSRVVILTYRPGTIKKDIAIELPYPRDTNSVEFNEIKRELAQIVHAEQDRFALDERKGLTLD